MANGALAVTSPGAQTSAEGAAVSLQVAATPPAGQSIGSYAAVGLPAGLDIDPTTGLVSGTVDSAAAETGGGVYHVSVSAADGAGDTGSQAFTWTVRHTDQAPVVTNPGDQLSVVGDSVSLTADGYDPDAGDVLSWSAAGLPAGLSIDATTGVISGTLQANATGSYAASVTASDGTLSDSQGFTWLVTNNGLTLATPADQANTEEDAATLQLRASNPNGSSPLHYTASGLPAGLGIDANTGLISGALAVGDAASGFGGAYVVTAGVDDGAGHSAGVHFNWTVAAADPPPALTNPGNQSSAEGAAVSLQIQATDPEGDGLTYSAGGLPAGLSIDPSSGLISGAVSTAAAKAGTSYTVKVGVTDGVGPAVTGHFTWTVSHVVQPPWLSNPLTQFGTVGVPVSLQLVAGSPGGDPLTYSASSLPPGLYINGTTGLITGSPGQAASFTTTVTVSDGPLSASQTFTWIVSQTTAPRVTLDVNGTPTRTDDVALLGAAPIPVVVTLHGAGPGQHEVDLFLPASDGSRASLSAAQLELLDGGSATVWLTALAASAAEDDVLIQAFVDPPAVGVMGLFAGDAKATIEDVTIPEHIRNEDTPKDMKDRIPPRVVTKEPVTLSIQLDEGQRIYFRVIGQSANNGTVKLLGDSNSDTDQVWADDKGTSYVGIRGDTQTAPTADGKGGNAGKLQLEAFVGGNEGSNKKSDGFSVAAIPIAVQMLKPRPVVGERETDVPGVMFTWGIEFKNRYISDSGPEHTDDLSGIRASEVIKTGKKATGSAILFFGADASDDYGTFDKAGTGTDTNGLSYGYDKATTKTPEEVRDEDVKDIQAAVQKEWGAASFYQHYVFADSRTGLAKVDAVPVQSSGYEISITLGTLPLVYTPFIGVLRKAVANNGAESGQLLDGADAKNLIAEIK